MLDRHHQILRNKLLHEVDKILKNLEQLSLSSKSVFSSISDLYKVRTESEKECLVEVMAKIEKTFFQPSDRDVIELEIKEKIRGN